MTRIKEHYKKGMKMYGAGYPGAVVPAQRSGEEKVAGQAAELRSTQEANGRASRQDRSPEEQKPMTSGLAMKMRLELEAVAQRAGWEIVATFSDEISGTKGRDKCPGLDELMKRTTAREFDMVLAWSVDRLGRSLQHLVHLIDEFKTLGSGPFAAASTKDAEATIWQKLHGPNPRPIGPPGRQISPPKASPWPMFGGRRPFWNPNWSGPW